MISIQSKLPNVSTTIFTVMSALANEYNAVNLGQGFPDFMMNEELIALVNKAMQSGFNQYTHMNGLPLLRERLAENTQKIYGTSINPETQITLTPGGSYAIYTALTTILQKDDEVIIFEPAYDCYIPGIEMNGAKVVTIQLQFPTYTIPWEEVKAKVNERTKIIMINSPHNPTGTVLQEADIEQLRAVVANTNIVILSDEVYEHLIFDAIPHLSMLRYPDLLERSYVCFSFGKTYHCTGWKLGYCIASPSLMKEYRKVHQFIAFSCDTPKQVALAEYLTDEDAYNNLGSFMQTKRDYFRTLMAVTPFTCIPSYGSYFECYSYNFTNESDKDLAIRLTKEYGVTAIPVSVFYKEGIDNHVLRFCFAKQEATLEKAVKRLRKLTSV
jgi:methionine aminotransferase